MTLKSVENFKWRDDAFCKSVNKYNSRISFLRIRNLPPAYSVGISTSYVPARELAFMFV